MIDLTQTRDTYLRLTFNEANIILENIIGLQTKTALLSRLQDLRAQTTDPALQEDLDLLLWKIAQISDADYRCLYAAVIAGRLLFPGDYLLTGSP